MFFEKVYYSFIRSVVRSFVHSFIYLAICTSLLQRSDEKPHPHQNINNATHVKQNRRRCDWFWELTNPSDSTEKRKNDGVWKSIADVMKIQSMCLLYAVRESKLWIVPIGCFFGASRPLIHIWLYYRSLVTPQFLVLCLWLETCYRNYTNSLNSVNLRYNQLERDSLFSKLWISWTSCFAKFPVSKH